MFYAISNLCQRGASPLTPINVWDPFYRDLMMATAARVMKHSGMRILRSLVRRNEITFVTQLEVNPDAEADERLNSLLVGEASASATVLAEMCVPFVGGPSYIFDTAGDTINYYRFLQRQNQKIATQMLLSKLLQTVGKKTKKQTSRILCGMNRAVQQQMLLSEFGIDIRVLPDWQQWGDSLYWVEIEGKRHLYTGEGLTDRKPFVIFQHMGEDDRVSEYE